MFSTVLAKSQLVSPVTAAEVYAQINQPKKMVYGPLTTPAHSLTGPTRLRELGYVQ